MWPFDRRQTKAEQVPASPAQGPGPSADQLAKIEAALEKLDRRATQLEMDWNEWFDKFRRLYARIAKRQERDEANEAPEGPQSPEDAPGPTIGYRGVVGGPHPRRNY